jgi:tetratricopeptide (TPR) repeat protein
MIATRHTFLLLIVLSLSVGLACAQTSHSLLTYSQARIAEDQQLIRTAELQQLPPEKQGALWSQLAAEYQYATEFSRAEDAYYKSLHLLKTAPSAAAEYAETLDRLASFYLIYDRVDDAESARKQALAVRQKLGNLSDISVSYVHLADIAFKRKQYKKAEQLAQRGIEGLESSPNPPREGMLSGLITLAYARCSLGHCSEGLTSAQQAVTFANQSYGSDSAPAGFALETLGFAEWRNGDPQDGEKAMVQSIHLLQAQLKPADPRLAGAMLQYQAYLLQAKRQPEAQQIQEQVTKMTSEAGTSCAGCISVYSLSKALR